MIRSFNRILKNTGYLSIAKAFNKILFLVLIIIISRYLGIKILGDYFFLFAYTTFILGFSGLGLSDLVIRESIKDKSNISNLIGNLIAIRIILFFILSIFLIISIIFIDKTLIIPLIILTFSNLFSSIREVLQIMFRIYERMEFESISEIIGDLVIVITGITLIILGFGLNGVIFGFLFGGLISLIFVYFIIKKKFNKIKFSINIEVWRYLIKNGYPFMANFVINKLVFNIDILILKLLSGSILVGIYGAAYTVIRNIRTFVTLFSRSLYPTLSIVYRKSKLRALSLYKRAYLFLTLISILIFTFIFIFSKEIILILYGEEFSRAILILKLFSITGFFLIINNVNKDFLYVINKEHSYMKILLLISIINLFLDIILFMQYELLGVVIATMISFILLFIITNIFIKFKY